jgi:hypothetical protein
MSCGRLIPPEEMLMYRMIIAVTVAALSLPCVALAQQAVSQDDPVAYALSAGPADIAAGATVMDMEGTILREGTNGWTCVPVPDAPMCIDEQWMSWMDAFMNQRDEVDVTGFGLAYMLRGDAGASNIDPYAEGPTPDNEWVVTGPHLMMIVPDEAMLAHFPTDPEAGGAYVMWRGHPLVHLMVPVEDDAIEVHR